MVHKAVFYHIVFLVMLAIVGLSACRNGPAAAPLVPSPAATPAVAQATRVLDSSTTSVAAEPAAAPARTTSLAVVADLPSGWRLGAPQTAAAWSDLLADKNPNDAAWAAALGVGSVQRVIPLQDAIRSDNPQILLVTVPRGGLPLQPYLRLTAEAMERLAGITVGHAAPDYALRAGEGPVGLVKYRWQVDGDAAARSGRLVAIPDLPTDSYLILIAAVDADAEQTLDAVIEAVVPTIGVKAIPTVP